MYSKASSLQTKGISFPATRVQKRNRTRAGTLNVTARFFQPKLTKGDRAVKDAKSVLMRHTDAFGKGPWNIYGVPKEVLDAMEVLIEHGKKEKTYEGTEGTWNGTWRLLYAPHLVALSTLMFSKVDVSYTFQRGGEIEANVKYTSPLFQKGWLNSSGGVGLAQSKRARVSFERFWVDVGDMDRPNASVKHSPIINALGKILFFEAIATFPVLYLDKDICVFRFPPLFSNLCARRSSRW